VNPGRLISVALAVVLALQAPVVADSETDLPVLAAEVPRGTGDVRKLEALSPIAKLVDGQISDWVGTSSLYGGTAVYSAGEYVYQDHLFDAYGPDDGRDAQRLALLDPAAETFPESYRLDALVMSDAPSQVEDVPVAELDFDTAYGDATSHQDNADLLETRVAADADNIYLLARTTTMDAQSSTALLALFDTGGEQRQRDVGFNSGLTTERGDVALFASSAGGVLVDLASGDATSVPVGVGAAGYDNAIEVAVPRSAVVDPGRACRAKGEGCKNGTSFQDLVIAALASGTANASGDGFAQLRLRTNDGDPHPNIANVAFRFGESVREWFDKNQALALHAGSIDAFFASVRTDELMAGTTQSYVPGSGYHDRIFVSDAAISQEKQNQGIYQHYGLYLPSSFDGEDPVPLQWWLHWRGGNAHTAAHLAPRIFKHFGEEVGTIVVAPAGRGTSRWYVGKGHVDFLEVWRDVFATFSIDAGRVYVTGHSMGGWGSYLMTILYPDRFAAGAPVAGPVTQGAWTGIDFAGCDEFEFDGNTPCYISANDGRPRDQHTRKLLENLRHVPLAILQGTLDELVPYSGVARNAERLMQLGYRHRFYTYPTYEHFSHPIADQWTEAAAYMHRFQRPENPAQVIYKRDMPFERATEEVRSDGVPLSFDFDSAYWMSGLTPANMTTGVAFFDGRSLAIPEDPFIALPDVAGPVAPGTTGPFVATGLQWLVTGTAPVTENAFEATLSGAEAVQLDLLRMSIDPSQAIAGTVSNDVDLELRLDGSFDSMPTVTVNGQPADVGMVEGILQIRLPAGQNGIVIQP